VLKLKEPLSLPDGTQVDVTVVAHEKGNGEPSQIMDDRSWESLTKLLTDCAIDTGMDRVRAPTIETKP
jgi:hypothetical protein